MTAGQPGRFDFHREFLADPGTKYDPAYAGREMLDGAWTHQIRLLPTQPSAYREARVWIDERVWLIRRVEIEEEENGNVREVALPELERKSPARPELVPVHASSRGPDHHPMKRVYRGTKAPRQ